MLERDRSQAASLGRLLNPRTVALVGLRDGTSQLENVAPTLEGDAEVFFVSSGSETILGRTTYPSVSAIGRPIDAVFAHLGATRTVELAEECADLGCGGLVLIASSFAESGAEGETLQRRLLDAAERGGMAMVGPNGLGYVNVPKSLALTLASKHRRRPGGLSIVSQSGSTMSAVVMAAWERPTIGLNAIISAGNEAATDLADYVDYLVDDPETSAIALVIETIRRPRAFFAAVAKARAAGKPIVALKLARHSRTQQMAASHTGALTGDAWTYDVALEQSGVIVARDPEELMDRVAILTQPAADPHRPVGRLGVITILGGIAALAYDIADDEGVDVPEMPQMSDWVSRNLPGVTVANPLDATGLALSKWSEIVHRYAASDEIDSLLFLHPLEENDDTPLSHSMIDDFIAAAKTTDKPFILANVSGPLGRFAFEQARDSGVLLIGHGVRATLRGLAGLDAFASASGKQARPEAPAAPRPDADPIETPAGLMLPFGATMELLAAHGVPVSPYVVVGAGDPVTAPAFAGPYVVKLANVPHRTELGAVRVRVEAGELPSVVTELRELAADHGHDRAVAIQPLADVEDEAIVGIQGTSELGPVVVFGLGGVLVEVIRRVGGRMAPLSREDARDLLAEFGDLQIMGGFRGRQPWDLDRLADILVGVGRLAASGSAWLESLDINPLVHGRDGFVAVDGLCIVRDEKKE